MFHLKIFDKVFFFIIKIIKKKKCFVKKVFHRLIFIIVMNGCFENVESSQPFLTVSPPTFHSGMLFK